ncbi:hypothetical protein F5Y13DRAFT_36478 [Hypoxylon sp. FL1857]|nr:hypothetical protein F5Y13DRAFT_36478 [Hypoxylon sp. FL1857]
METRRDVAIAPKTIIPPHTVSWICCLILVGLVSAFMAARCTHGINQLMPHYLSTCTCLPNSTDVVPLHLVHWLRYYIPPIILLSTAVCVLFPAGTWKLEPRAHVEEVASRVSPSRLARYARYARCFAVRYRKAPSAPT